MSQSIESYEREQDRLEEQADAEEAFEAQEHPVNPAILFEESEDPGLELCPECDGQTWLRSTLKMCPVCDGKGTL